MFHKSVRLSIDDENISEAHGAVQIPFFLLKFANNVIHERVNKIQSSVLRPQDLSVGLSIWKEVGLSVINEGLTLHRGVGRLQQDFHLSPGPLFLHFAPSPSAKNKIKGTRCAKNIATIPYILISFTKKDFSVLLTEYEKRIISREAKVQLHS